MAGCRTKVMALAPGADGALWVGTEAAGWPGSTRTASGAPTARTAPMAGCRTDRSRRWRPARTARSGSEPGGGLARLDKDGGWQTYSKASTKGGLPDDRVWALAPGADGALWVGTDGGGLARLDKDGEWQTYSKDSTKGGLPDDRVEGAGARRGRRALGRNRGGGLARLDKGGEWHTYSKDGTHGGLPDDGLGAGARRGRRALGRNRRRAGPARQGRRVANLQQGQHPWRAAADRVWRWRPARTARSGSEPGGGLARLDKGGGWRTYSKDGTHGGLPDDSGHGAGARRGRRALGRNRWRAGPARPGRRVANLQQGRHPWRAAGRHGLGAGARRGRRALGRNLGGGWPGSARTGSGEPTARTAPTAACRRKRSGAGARRGRRALDRNSNGGLARRGNEGDWQTFTLANTKGGLPGGTVSDALALGADGALWVGTDGGGLARRGQRGRLADLHTGQH